jgi:hypothetical protein
VKVNDIPLEKLSALVAEHVMGEPKPKDLIDGTEYHETSGWDPENPWPEVEGVLNDLNGSVGTFVQHYSDGGNWKIIRRYENKDRPEWWPLGFAYNLDLAQKAVDKFWEGQWHDEDMPPTMLLEYFPRPSLDHHWMAYYNMKYGYGNTPSEAICRLLLIKVREEEQESKE